jgi:hypothetical protein
MNEKRRVERVLDSEFESTSKATERSGFEASVDQTKPAGESLNRLHQKPSSVDEYIADALIVPERALGARSSMISDLTSQGRDDFRKIIFYLGDPLLGADAREWLVANEGLSEAAKKRLGVKNVIDGPGDALRALRLIIRMFQDARIPLLLYLDQLDHLLVGLDSLTVRENSERIKSLVEYASSSNAFLVLAGPDSVWKHFREDFFTRVGPTVHLREIPKDLCKDLVKVYLRDEHPFTRYSGPSDIVPFDEEAVDEIWSLRGGNPRRFVQTCNQVFNHHLASGGLISRDLVLKTVREKQALLDRNNLVQEVRGLLKTKNLEFSVDAHLLDVAADFLVGTSRRPRAVIKILTAAFYRDEAESALHLARQIDSLHRHFPDVRTVVIAIGYVSSAIQGQLQQAFDLSLIYEGEGFSQEFDAALDSLLTIDRPQPETDDPRVKQEIIEGVAASLERLLAERDKQFQSLSSRLDNLTRLDQQRSPGQKEKQQQWRNWLSQDQQRWDQRLASLKKNAQDEQLRMQEGTEHLRQSQLRFQSALVLLGGTILGLAAFPISKFCLSLFPVYSEFRKISDAPFILSLAVTLVASLGYLYIYVYQKHFPLGLQTNEIARSQGDLNQIALRAKTTKISSKQLRHCLRNINPLIRYFGVQASLSPKQIESFSGFDWLTPAAQETWAPLYEVYLTAASRKADSAAFLDHIRLLAESDPNDPRLVTAVALLSKRLSKAAFEFMSATNVPEKLFAHAIFQSPSLTSSEIEASWSRGRPFVEFALHYRSFTLSPRMDLLVRRFREQGQFWDEGADPPLQVSLREEELRLIIDALSPHREFGLASLHRLSTHLFYFRLYRFFSEIEWRSGVGDVTLAQISTSTADP